MKIMALIMLNLFTATAFASAATQDFNVKMVEMTESDSVELWKDIGRLIAEPGSVWIYRGMGEGAPHLIPLTKEKVECNPCKTWEMFHAILNKSIGKLSLDLTLVSRIANACRVRFAQSVTIALGDGKMPKFENQKYVICPDSDFEVLIYGDITIDTKKPILMRTGKLVANEDLRVRVSYCTERFLPVLEDIESLQTCIKTVEHDIVEELKANAVLPTVSMKAKKRARFVMQEQPDAIEFDMRGKGQVSVYAVGLKKTQFGLKKGKTIVENDDPIPAGSGKPYELQIKQDGYYVEVSRCRYAEWSKPVVHQNQTSLTFEHRYHYKLEILKRDSNKLKGSFVFNTFFAPIAPIMNLVD